MAEAESITTVPLFHHQRLSCHKMIETEKRNWVSYTNMSGRDRESKLRLGILSDPVGSGKSLVILYHVANDLKAERIINEEQSIIYIAKGTLPRRYTLGYNKQKHISARHEPDDLVIPNMLIIPHMLYKQWSGYITKFIPSLLKDTIIIYNKKTLEQYLSTYNDTIYNFIIITDKMNKKLYDNCRETIRIKRLLIDEFDSLKGIRIYYKTEYIWVITSSIHNIYNPSPYVKKNTVHDRGVLSKELRYIVNSLDENLLRKIIIRNDEEIIKQSIALPPPNIQTIHYIQSSNSYILEGLIPSRAMELIECGDEQSAITSLGIHTDDSEENLVKTFVKQIDYKILKINTDFNYQINNPTLNERQKNTLKSQMDIEIKKLESRKKLIEERMKETMCYICYCDIQTRTMTKCCHSSFCLNCLSTWLNRNKRCPLCASTITLSDIYTVKKNCKSNSYAPSNKQAFIDYIKNMDLENSTILVYNSSKDTCMHLISMLKQDYNISAEFLSGHINRINNLLKKFKNKEINILFADPYTYSSGLNLEYTTHIILYTKYSRDTETQCIGRAQRLGRTVPLNIIKLNPIYQPQN